MEGLSKVKIMFLGDSHADKVFVKRALGVCKELGIDQIVQVGDFGFWVGDRNGKIFLQEVSDYSVKLGIPIYWLAGNHEDYNYIDRLIDEHGRSDFIETHPNLFYIPSGFAWDWDGLRFGCLSGAFSIDRDRRTEGFDWFPQEMPDLTLIEGLGELDILLSHDSPIVPTMIYASGNFKRHPQSEESQKTVYDALVRTKPYLQVVGHWHHNERMLVAGATVQVLDCNYTNLQYSSCVLDTVTKTLYTLEQFAHGAEGDKFV